MPSWDPNQYLKYADHRTRPALDLMDRIAVEAPKLVVDVGCGPGEQARAFAERHPQAEVIGLDSSADMLAKARQKPGRVAWQHADLRTWAPPRPIDLLFSNAVLHWVDDHAALMPRVAGWLAPAGVLAIQMPRNFDAPSHRIMREVAADGPWRDRLAGRLQAEPVAAPEDYYRWLAPLLGHLDIWQTEYLHQLQGDDPVLEWVRGTALRPALDALDAETGAAFTATYAARLRAAYPKETDGRTLFPVRRLFIVGRR